ncbi:SDR family oxidoreductase [Bradyrhizobium barranii subsp. barranii]|uniref:SDR family oxidoreductase n=1 Tax=Bradyrhizobium barranii subsp. barranii TaxID=2823807 RepID=A0A7Z0TSD3_9BRAD|nr:SDR family oxidoreductase [Bradyrhizobium barranii]UGX92030.1 SDR family oxidoreductase [Bradyrhizobium barranii subsp. barranii]
MTNTALVVGASGIVGSNLARHLSDRGWEVLGLARRPPSGLDGVRPIAADLQDPASLRDILASLRPTHVFLATWLRQPTEAENIRVNAAMVRNVLEALSGADTLSHVALVTGLKHYLGPFESYGKGRLPATPFREEQPRLDVENFYYAQEDELFDAARRGGFSWSIHRPHTIIGYAIGNAMNMGTTLAVYATICRETGRPFLFPGSAMQWTGLTDMTDARLLARHLEWAATTTVARDQAFNVVNGDVFRWSWMWARLAGWFGLQPAPFLEEISPLERQLADSGRIWADIALKYDLVERDLSVLSSAWHTDADLGRPIEVVTDMSKSRKLGFLEYQATDDSFFDLFSRLRAANVIP